MQGTVCLLSGTLRVIVFVLRGVLNLYSLLPQVSTSLILFFPLCTLVVCDVEASLPPNSPQCCLICTRGHSLLKLLVSCPCLPTLLSPPLPSPPSHSLSLFHFHSLPYGCARTSGNGFLQTRANPTGCPVPIVECSHAVCVTLSETQCGIQSPACVTLSVTRCGKQARCMRHSNNCKCRMVMAEIVPGSPRKSIMICPH